MKALHILVLFGTTMLGFTSATASGLAGQFDLLAPFDNFSILEPPDPPAPGGPKSYSTTGKNATWLVAQWNIPGPKLSSFLEKHDNGTTTFEASAPEAAIQIIRSSKDTKVILSQDGAALPCYNSQNNRSRESDLFISESISDSSIESRSLSKLSKLMQFVKITSVSGPASTNKGCHENKGGALTSVILSNKIIHPTQTFFYQLGLSMVCRESRGANACHKTPNEIAYFARKSPYGVDDYIPLIGSPWVTGDTLTNVDIDILPRIEQAMAAGPPGLDRDLSHWVVTSAYGGQHIWGDVKLKTEWQDFRLVAVVPR